MNHKLFKFVLITLIFTHETYKYLFNNQMHTSITRINEASRGS